MAGFKKFLLRGNVVELAVAVVIGLAFAALVTAFVAAFITPLVGALTGAVGDFRIKSFTVNHTRFPYGEFVQALLTFVVTAAAIYFFVVQPIQAMTARFKAEPEVDASIRECTECLSMIPRAARRCSFCTSPQVTV